MKKIQHLGALFVAIALVSSASLAHAQSNSYNYTSGNLVCISLTNYLKLGSVDVGSGGQVTLLQEFLNRTGYLNGVSGFYNQGTYGAVVNYQRDHGIPQTGTVGPITRAAINQQSCAGAYTNTNSGTTYAPGPASISSLSSTSGVPGSSVTIYGTNFLNSNSVVHFGGSTVSASYTTNSAITFTVPSFATGTYQVYVTNAYGSSNSISYSLTWQSNTNNNCYYVNGSSQCGCGYNQNYSYGYSYTNNNNYSYMSCGANNPPSGTWYGGNGQPSISVISGVASAPTGTSYTWTASAYSQKNLPITVSVDWADGSVQPSTHSYSNSYQPQTYSFTHTYSNPGLYTIRFTVTDSSGAYAYSTQTVNVTGSYNNCNYNYNNCTTTYSYGTPNISYLSQMSGSRGSTITINGSNFSPNVTVLFGGETYNATSFNNGTTITFITPYYYSGNYVLSVMNTNGQTSNSLTYTIW